MEYGSRAKGPVLGPVRSFSAIVKYMKKRDRFSVTLYATEERSHKYEKFYANYAPYFNFSVTAELKDVTSRLIILTKEINETNCMISNSAKLDSMTKQHTQFGVSASHSSRDMVRTKTWRGKKIMNKGKTIYRPLRGSLIRSKIKQHTLYT